MTNVYPIFSSSQNQKKMETEHLSLAERISKEVNLDSLAYIDKEVSIKEKKVRHSMMSQECKNWLIL